MEMLKSLVLAGFFLIGIVLPFCSSIEDPLKHVQHRLEPLEKQLTEHPIYDELDSVSDLGIFMHHHVYGVLDFMSLLKYLQNTFAPSSFPWKPLGDPSIRRFINEIVMEEESDHGSAKREGYASHFELYCKAMEEVNVTSSTARSFANQLSGLESVQGLLASSNIPAPAKDFLASTFSTLVGDKPHVVAASFAFGREHIIPKMFSEFLRRMHIRKDEAPTFHYYLDRHIEVDGGSHGPLSMRMLRQICGTDAVRWREVEEGAVRAIENRIRFWDAVLVQIKKSRKVTKQTEQSLRCDL